MQRVIEFQCRFGGNDQFIRERGKFFHLREIAAIMRQPCESRRVGDERREFGVPCARIAKQRARSVRHIIFIAIKRGLNCIHIAPCFKRENGSARRNRVKQNEDEKSKGEKNFSQRKHRVGL